MPDETRLLTVSWILLLVNGIAIFGFGMIIVVYPQIAGSTEGGLWRSIGVATTGMGLFGIAITLWSFRMKERWAWVVLWFYPVFWTVHLVWDLPPGNDHIHQITLIVMSLLGLLLPARQFFPRNSVKLR